MSEGVNEAIDHAEAVINPVRGSRIVLKIVAMILVVLLAAFAVRLVTHYLWRSEDVTKTVTTDKVWFARTAEEVRALDVEIQAAQHALERKKEESASRWVSRAEDRAEFDRLNGAILGLQHRRAELVKDYNTAAAINPQLGVAAIDSR